MLFKWMFYLLCCIISANSVLADTIGYYHDDLGEFDSEKISTIAFTAFDYEIKKGVNNGIYWLKVETGSDTEVIELQRPHLLDVRCYEGAKELTAPARSIYPYFYVKPNETYFLRVDCYREASIAVKTQSKTAFFESQKFYFLKIGAYYGIALMVMVMNCFYFVNFRENTFLYYSAFLGSIVISLAYLDGLAMYLIGPSYFLQYGEAFIHASIAITGFVFADAYLQFNLYLPRIRRLVFYPLILIMLVLYSIYLYTDWFIIYAWGDITAISILAICWICSLVLWRKNTFSKVFALAYSFILFFGYDFYVTPLLALPSIGINADLFKFSSLFEMLLLSAGVIYRIYLLQKENQQMQGVIFEATSQVEFLEEELQKLKEGKENLITKALLNSREIEVLEMISQGKTNKEMAFELNISVNTVKYHTKKLYDKLDISSRQEARLKAVEIQRFTT